MWAELHQPQETLCKKNTPRAETEPEFVFFCPHWPIVTMPFPNPRGWPPISPSSQGLLSSPGLWTTCSRNLGRNWSKRFLPNNPWTHNSQTNPQFWLPGSFLAPNPLHMWLLSKPCSWTSEILCNKPSLHKTQNYSTLEKICQLLNTLFYLESARIHRENDQGRNKCTFMVCWKLGDIKRCSRLAHRSQIFAPSPFSRQLKTPNKTPNAFVAFSFSGF